MSYVVRQTHHIRVQFQYKVVATYVLAKYILYYRSRALGIPTYQTAIFVFFHAIFYHCYSTAIKQTLRSLVKSGLSMAYSNADTFG
jgi:hypothetical protein